MHTLITLDEIIVNIILEHTERHTCTDTQRHACTHRNSQNMQEWV